MTSHPPRGIQTTLRDLRCPYSSPRRCRKRRLFPLVKTRYVISSSRKHSRAIGAVSRAHVRLLVSVARYIEHTIPVRGASTRPAAPSIATRYRTCALAPSCLEFRLDVGRRRATWSSPAARDVGVASGVRVRFSKERAPEQKGIAGKMTPTLQFKAVALIPLSLMGEWRVSVFCFLDLFFSFFLF